MEIDLHGYEVAEAVIEIFSLLEECKITGEKELVVIHGYKNGTRIKSYLLSKKFMDRAKKYGYNIKIRGDKHNPGSSTIYLLD